MNRPSNTQATQATQAALSAFHTFVLVLLMSVFSQTLAQTTGFTYQGKLNDGGSPASGAYDLQFKLFDSPAGGVQQGATLSRDDVTVTGGIFTVTLDFGAAAFAGADRFLEISVRAGASTGAYTTLTPRQPITPTPYAIRSQSAAAADTATNATNAVNATIAASATTATNATTATTATNFSGALAGDVTGTQTATAVGKLQGRNVAATVPSNGQVLKFNSTTNQWEPAADANSGGTITGVTAGTGSSGGGTSGAVTVNIAAGGVGANELATNAVTNAKIADVAGSKITGSITTATIPGANVSGAVANATNATTATNFSGALSGDVAGTQTATTVGKLQGRNVAATAPANGQVLKFNTTTNQWEPGADSTGSVSAPLNLTASNAAPIIAGTNTGAGDGLAGTGANGNGVYGSSASANGVKGEVGGNSARSDIAGLYGYSGNDGGNGVIGEANNGAAAYGVWGISTSGRGVVGENRNTTRLGASPGVYGEGLAEDGVWAISSSGNGLYASGGDYAAYLAGKVYIGGPLEKPAGSFKIDHPLDPENKYLYHSFVESPDMKNIYDGVAVLGEDGTVTIELPEWFGALNRDFRYQLTAIGAPAPGLYVAQKVVGNRFKIAGGAPGLEVSWQVTGIRQDAYANKHRIEVEVEKAPQDRGTYLHPDAFNQPEEKGADWKQQQNRAKEMQRLRNQSGNPTTPRRQN
ncbi:MAG TPA: hypothetical protein PLD20_28230 [Blastocatellia bacterium]|nr:hypothetical protein [Blastocatellia bacterium]